MEGEQKGSALTVLDEVPVSEPARVAGLALRGPRNSKSAHQLHTKHPGWYVGAGCAGEGAHRRPDAAVGGVGAEVYVHAVP